MKEKTWKREFAFLMFCHIVYLSLNQLNFELIQILIWPYMLYILGAFGLDTARKQLDIPGVSK